MPSYPCPNLAQRLCRKSRSADGVIENIAEDTVPYSLDPVESTGPVAAVLELRAGLAKELGLDAGDTVRWK